MWHLLMCLLLRRCLPSHLLNHKPSMKRFIMIHNHPSSYHLYYWDLWTLNPLEPHDITSPWSMPYPDLSNRSPSSHWTSFNITMDNCPITHWSSWCSLIFPREIQRMVILNLSQAPHSGVSMNSAILTEVALPSAEAVMQHQSWRWFVHLDWVYHKKALGWTWMCIPAGKCIIRIWTQKKSLNQLLKCYISIWFYMHISCYMSETTEREVWLYSNPNYSEKDRKANSKPLNLKPQSIYIYIYLSDHDVCFHCFNLNTFQVPPASPSSSASPAAWLALASWAPPAAWRGARSSPAPQLRRAASRV